MGRARPTRRRWRASARLSGAVLFRVAIPNSRLEQIDDTHVTFRYQDNRTQETRRATLSGVEFLRRFLQHVLPRRCMKVRYYGLWSATRRADLEHARDRLQAARATAAPIEVPVTPTHHHHHQRRPGSSADLSAVSRRHTDRDRDPAPGAQGASMTGGRGRASTRHAVMHVRPARGGRGLCARGSQPLSTGLTRRRSARSTRPVVHGRLKTEPLCGPSASSHRWRSRERPFTLQIALPVPKLSPTRDFVAAPRDQNPQFVSAQGATAVVIGRPKLDHLLRFEFPEHPRHALALKEAYEQVQVRRVLISGARRASGGRIRKRLPEIGDRLLGLFRSTGEELMKLFVYERRE